MKGKLIIGLTLFSIFSFWKIEIPKRAFRQYEKGDYEKTVDALEKSLRGDTLNPASHFLYAKLYIDTAFVNYNIDSAFKSVNRSIEQLSLVEDPDDLEDLAEYKVDQFNLDLIKDEIDSLKFMKVKEAHTLEAYNAFMSIHDDAKQLDEAKRLRDHIAFEQASEMNIWQSYRSFMEEYPNAEDYATADSLYKLLIYQDLTEDQTLSSYVEFLEGYPQSPYRPKVEERIYELSTAQNTIDAYLNFLNQYPNDSLAAKILPRGYHIYKEKYGSDSFLDHFNIPTKTDSIKNIIALEQGYWIPKLDNGRYTFINQSGEVKLISFFKSLPEHYLCEPIYTDFIYGRINGHQRIQGRNGHVIYEGEFDEAQDAGYGFIKLISSDGERLIHKSGEVIVSELHQEITVLSNSLIRLKQNDFYGLTSINGIKYLETEYSSIEWFQDYLWLQKEEGIALINPETLYPALIGEYVNLPFEYQDLDLLDNGRIWAMKNGKEGILDLDLKEVIPFDDYEIYEQPYGWKLIANGRTAIVHDKFPELTGSSFEGVQENDRWLALMKDSTWMLYDQLGDLEMEEFDSLSLLGENMVMLKKGDQEWAQFKNGKRIPMEKGWSGRLLIPQSYIKTGKQANHDYYMLSNSKKFRKIYNEWGKEILAATYNEVTALDPNMLRLQKTNTALVDSLGVFLLNFVYDGVGSNENGYLSILDAGKVGIINPAKRILIKPSYSKLIEPYSDTVLVASKANYKGFINKNNEQLSAFDFDEVRYWNDSIALVRIEDEWIFHDIAQELPIYEGMLEYEVLRSNAEGSLLKVTKESGAGLYHTQKGEVIEPTFDDIKVLGSDEEPIFFSLKIVEEADLYVVIYYDLNGNKLFTQSLSREDYDKIACQ